MIARQPGVWSQGSFAKKYYMNKSSGGNRIPAEPFKILKKNNATKVLHFKVSANLENSAMTTGLEMVSFHFNLKGGKYQRMFKQLYSCTHFMY